ncbi:putative DNA binding domain-containing protein [Paracoccus sp. MC1854]|uniref:RNA-binding domain-containing protein n=1 Tax=Paracoccus sp. MC1854 TaxID=2760306 RepID=UPI0016013BD0|nr:RNA-binding domain-containing protein [Paracoccus sp. MC1854]MBB1492292.1 putative DNA binding domain-containing protein [Paracoccus sp. MC1854]
MKLVGQSETEWLELKAGCYPGGGRFERGTNADDYRWNVAKAVIALANSIGGVLLLGVADDGGVVGIEASDPKGRRRSKGAEAFRREIVMQQVLLPANGWKTGRQGNFRLVNAALLERLVALEEIPQGEQSVLAIFVDPAPSSFGFVEVEVEVEVPQDTAAVSRIVYLRKRGAVGQVVALTADQADVLSAHEVQRQQRAAEIKPVWKRFEESGWLARSAEELLPDVRRYLTALEARLAPSSARFIPLMAVQRRGTGPVADGKARELDDGDNWARSEAPRASESHEVLRTEPEQRRGLVTELLSQSRRALLIGEGGSGKSRCLAALAIDAACGWQPDRPWPLLVSLSAYTGEGLSRLLATESGIDWQDLAPRIEGGELTLCLDGLNECPDLLYDQCLADIAGILRDYPTAGVLLTSRTAQLPPGLQLEVFEIEPMDRARQSKFLARYLGQPQQVEPILAQLHLHAGGSAIAGSPMLLRIAAEVARETHEIPTQRSALYRRFLDAWFRREVETARRGGQALSWERELAIGALAELAFQARQKGSGRMPLAQAKDLLVHRLGEDTGRFIDWASQGTVLVRNTGREELVFEHETVQEYLCAEYLVARHEDMHGDVLALRADAKPGIWAMPLAFAFEMLAEPSPALMNAAWRIEPLIVAAGTRGTAHYRAEEVTEDLWIRAVLNILLGQDAAAQARALAIIARSPPKYPISPYLLASLHSPGFWYSAQTHAAGAARLERLRDLVGGTDFPWIELLADALVGCKSWGEGLSPALRALAGVSPTPTLIEVLSSASVSELCALRRRKMISAETFVSSWKAALDRSRAERLDLDLLDILRTEKEQVNDILREMLPLYKAELRRISVEPELSLRLLSILLRSGAVRAGELRERPGFLANVCARTSMINAIRLAQQGLLSRADINAATRARLVYDRNTKPGYLRQAIKIGLLELQDLPAQLREQIAVDGPSSRNTPVARSGRSRFTAAMLGDASSRMKVNAELAKTRWMVVLKRIPAKRGFGFARHPDFEQDIFCLLSKIAATDRSKLREAQVLDVQITTRFDAGRKAWGFAVESGRCVD